jgi:cell wall integrity and stress response component
MYTTFRTAAAVSLLLYAAGTNAQTCGVALKTMINVGCYSSGGQLVDLGSYTYQSAGYCQCQCATLNKAVMATYKGSDCYCGDLLPPTGSVASNSSCNSPCQGYDSAMCGGDSFWSVALTGIESNVGSAGSSSSSSQPPTVTQTAAPSVITKAGQTVVVTASSSSSNGSQGGRSGSKAGIAAGVVVGIVAISSMVGGVYFFLRQRKRRAVEEEFRRNADVSSFVGGKSKSEVSSTNDQRLDPSVMFARRQSIGSIADERDFSRRILQVGRFAPGLLALLAPTLLEYRICKTDDAIGAESG